MNDSPNLADLTFVTRKSDGTLDLWTPERPELYAVANAMGRDYAAELLMMIRHSNNPVLFGAVIRAIARSGEYGAVEIGFCHSIGVELAGMRVETAAVSTMNPPLADAA